MGSEIQLIAGHRIQPLTSKTLPELAAAITGCLTGFGAITKDINGGTYYTHLVGSDFDVVVTAKDWARIEPYLLDGTLRMSVYPSAHVTDSTGVLRILRGIFDVERR